MNWRFNITLGRQIQLAVCVFVLLPATLGYGPASAFFERIDLALRWSHVLGPIDIGLAHFHGTSREPALRLARDASGAPIASETCFTMMSKTFVLNRTAFLTCCLNHSDWEQYISFRKKMFKLQKRKFSL